RNDKTQRLRIVHRLDKETSGLAVFARTAEAERNLGRQFKAHTVIRRYLAIVPGTVTSQRVESFLLRDRGDGRRGRATAKDGGKRAVTHVDVVQHLPGYTLLSCRLETGRTHQIRIHLAELGHPVCGDKVYVHRRDGTLFEDRSGAPRLCLHAAELGFTHPVTEEELSWTMPLPADMAGLLARLRGGGDMHRDVGSFSPKESGGHHRRRPSLRHQRSSLLPRSATAMRSGRPSPFRSAAITWLALTHFSFRMCIFHGTFRGSPGFSNQTRRPFDPQAVATTSRWPSPSRS